MSTKKCEELFQSISDDVDDDAVLLLRSLLDQVRSECVQMGKSFPEPSFIVSDGTNENPRRAFIIRWGHRLCWFCDTVEPTVHMIVGSEEGEMLAWFDENTPNRLARCLVE